MAAPPVVYDGPLRRGTFRERLDRFSPRATVDGESRDRYRRNSGGLETVLAPGQDLLCRFAASDDRKTDFDAIAVDVHGTWVTVDATPPNDAFEACPGDGTLPRFAGYGVAATEPTLPREGRTDFLLEGLDGDAYVEVTSCSSSSGRTSP